MLRDFYNTYSGNVPIYPMPMNNMMPGNVMPYPYQNQMNNQDSCINNQIANLEKRVSNLEKLVGNNYNNSNFQVL